MGWKRWHNFFLPPWNYSDKQHPACSVASGLLQYTNLIINLIYFISRLESMWWYLCCWFSARPRQHYVEPDLWPHVYSDIINMSGALKTRLYNMVWKDENSVMCSDSEGWLIHLMSTYSEFSNTLLVFCENWVLALMSFLFSSSCLK